MIKIIVNGRKDSMDIKEEDEGHNDGEDQEDMEGDGDMEEKEGEDYYKNEEGQEGRVDGLEYKSMKRGKKNEVNLI